jgi:predicted ATPase
LAETQGADGPVLAARRMLGTCLFLCGELSASRECIERALAVYDPARHRALTFQYGAEHQSAGLAWLALDLFLLGYPVQAAQAGHKAIILAKGVAHAITEAHALRVGGCFLSAARRDKRSAYEQASALKAYSVQQRLEYWRAQAEFILAWATEEPTPEEAALQMRQTLAELDLTETRTERSFFLALLADTYGRCGQLAAGLDVLDEALAAAQNADEYWWVADIYRLKGQMLLSLGAGNSAAAEEYYKRAISTAQRQSAKSLELRASTDLARLWYSQKKCDEARGLLASIYDWFTEGFDTPDLKDAKGLLDLLGP